jgi:hypothetical protein
MPKKYLTAEQEKNFFDRCQAAMLKGKALQLLWTEIRDQIVELEKQSDDDDLVDYLNNELYSAMYPAWSEYKKIEKMMEETGTAEWLNDTLSFEVPEAVRVTPGNNELDQIHSDPNNNTLSNSQKIDWSKNN